MSGLPFVPHHGSPQGSAMTMKPCVPRQPVTPGATRAPQAAWSLRAESPSVQRRFCGVCGNRTVRPPAHALCPLPSAPLLVPYLHLGLTPGIQADGLDLADLGDVPMEPRAAQTDEDPQRVGGPVGI